MEGGCEVLRTFPGERRGACAHLLRSSSSPALPGILPPSKTNTAVMPACFSMMARFMNELTNLQKSSARRGRSGLRQSRWGKDVINVNGAGIS